MDSASVMVWGCFSGKGGRGSLFFLPAKTTMNYKTYIKVMKEKLVPWMKLHKTSKFLQDGAPCHTRRKKMAVLKAEKIEAMDWPGNSPDLNPIKNLWSIMKARLKRDHTITSLPLLINAIKKMWVTDLPISMMKKLARSMPTRIKKWLENAGQMTKY
jgi:DDE superfamily endonuclease